MSKHDFKSGECTRDHYDLSGKRAIELFRNYEPCLQVVHALMQVAVQARSDRTLTPNEAFAVAIGAMKDPRPTIGMHVCPDNLEALRTECLNLISIIEDIQREKTSAA